MSHLPQTDVSRPSALPTANLLHRSHSLTDQNSSQYLDAIEEEWNKKLDMEIETLVDGMVDLVSLASISDKDKFTIAQEAFQAQSRAESMVSLFFYSLPSRLRLMSKGSSCQLPAVHHPLHEATAFTL
jgi:mediator of RNA polymerase II transcription subunit 22